MGCQPVELDNAAPSEPKQENLSVDFAKSQKMCQPVELDNAAPTKQKQEKISGQKNRQPDTISESVTFNPSSKQDDAVTITDTITAADQTENEKERTNRLLREAREKSAV